MAALAGAITRAYGVGVLEGARAGAGSGTGSPTGWEDRMSLARRLGEIIGLLGEVRRELGAWPARGTREPKGRHLQQLARRFKVSAGDVLPLDPAGDTEGKMAA